MPVQVERRREERWGRERKTAAEQDLQLSARRLLHKAYRATGFETSLVEQTPALEPCASDCSWMLLSWGETEPSAG